MNEPWVQPGIYRNNANRTVPQRNAWSVATMMRGAWAGLRRLLGYAEKPLDAQQHGRDGRAAGLRRAA